MADASAALPSRLIVPQLTRSWYDREDPGLTGRLTAERTGVFLWAAEGLRRLRGRGRFVHPATGEGAARDVVELSSPVTAFVGECCELGPGLEVSRRWLFEAWRSWCLDHGHPEGNSGTFGRNLKAAFPEVGQSRPGTGADRDRHYTGIGLKGAGPAGHGGALLPPASRQRPGSVQATVQAGI